MTTVATDVFAHTIIVADGEDPMTTLIAEHLVAWSTRGLLRQLAFVAHIEVAQDGRLESLPHRLLLDGVTYTGDLFDWLAANYCDLTRIVALHVDPNSGQSEQVWRAAERCRSEIGARQGRSQRLSQFAVYLGAPGHGQYPAHHVGPAFQNLVVVPVDQAMPGSGAAPLAPTEHGQPSVRYAAVAAQTLATLSGSWLFQRQGALDDRSTGSAPTGVQVVRSYLRTMDVPDPVPTLTDRTLQPDSVDGVMSWPLPTGAVSTVPANPAEHFTIKAANDLAQRHSEVVTLYDLPAPEPLEPTKVGFFTALKMFGRYLLSGLTAAPGLVASRLSAAASAVATSAVFGRGSQFEIVIGRRGPRPATDLDAVERAISLALRAVDPAAEYLPSAAIELWHGYALIATALVDGSDFPEGVPRPAVGDSRAVVQNPHLVVVDPGHPCHEIPAAAFGEGGVPVQVCAHDPRAVLSARRALARLAMDGAGGTQPDPDTEPAADQRGRGTTAGASSSVPSASAEEPAGDALPPGVETGDQLDQSHSSDSSRSSEGSGRTVHSDAKEALEELDAWTAPFESAFSWRFGSHLAEALLDAEERVAQAAATLAAGPPQRPAYGIDARTSVLGSLASGFTTGLIVFLFFFLIRDTWDNGLYAWLACFVFGLVGAFWSYMRAMRHQFRATYRYNLRIAELNHASNAFTRYSTEVLRLSSLYWQYQRWTRILGGLLHRPFGPPQPADGAGSALMVDTTALAVRSAVAELDRSGLDSKVQRLRRATFTVGWLQQAWSDAEQGITGDFCRQRGLDEPPNPLKDTMRRNSGLLDHLANAVEADYHGHLSRRYRIADIRRRVSTFSLERIVRDVRVDGVHPYPDAIAPTNSPEGDGLFGELLEFGEDQVQEYHHELWASAGLDASSTVAETVVQTTPFLAEQASAALRFSNGSRQRSRSGQAITVVPTAPVEHNGRTLYGSARLDLSEVCRPKDLVIFEETAQERTSTWYEPTAEGD